MVIALRSGLVGGFTVRVDVQAFAFDVFADPQAEHQPGDQEADHRNDADPHDGQAHAQRLAPG